MKLAKLLFFLLVYLHMAGCGWFLIIKQSRVWVPPVDYLEGSTVFYESALVNQYFMSFYTSCQFLTSNDYFPSEDLEILYACCCCLAGALLNANLFGQLAVLVQNLNRKAAALQKKIDISNTAMTNMQLPKDIQEQVFAFIKSTHSSFD